LENEATELEMLKQRAKLMGIPIVGNIKIETLRDRINEKLRAQGEGPEDPDEDEDGDVSYDPGENDDEVDDLSDYPEVEDDLIEAAQAQVEEVLRLDDFLDDDLKPQRWEELRKERQLSKKQRMELAQGQFRKRLTQREMKLIRCRITNLNPAKNDLHGEIFTFSNKLLGAVKRFIPYGEAGANGWHVPYCMFKMLKNKKYQVIKTTKNDRTNTEQVERYLSSEFNLEVLPPLSKAEIDQLAQAQLSRGDTTVGTGGRQML